MRMPHRIGALLAAAIVLLGLLAAPASADVAKKPTDPNFDVYTTPGTWDYNGREWNTWCEKYSQTERCHTYIWATQITLKDGTYHRLNSWVFNNLTYKPSPRGIWADNPLGGYGQIGYDDEWTAADGRFWRTECDTAASGRGGCRAYLLATVHEFFPGDGYVSYNKWVFNNIVRFS